MSAVASALPPGALAAILAWFDARGRTFPFRGVRDPYAVLVSEVMAQQTQIARASERWQRFIARFPSVHALAAATPADVLREWRGLGYNRRALNLWRTARAVVEEHGGRVPDTVEALERLPGVGPYTARAVAAIAFGRPVGAVDTNVRRVLGRIVPGGHALDSRRLQGIADDAVPTDRPADWTHALMDLGATVCRPVAPDCPACPASAWCAFSREAATPVHRVPGPEGIPFASTSRWLRGRLLDALRHGPDAEWTRIETPGGDHDRAAVERALDALERDGLIERHPTDCARARLPLG